MINQKKISASNCITASKLLKAHHLLLLVTRNKNDLGYSMKELSNMTGLGDSAVSMAKTALEADKLAITHRPERDKRGAKLYLTDLGKERADYYRRQLKDLIEP